MKDYARNLRADVGDLKGGDPAGKLLLQGRAALLNDDEADARGSALPAAAARTALRVASAAAPAGCEEQKRGEASAQTKWDR